MVSWWASAKSEGAITTFFDFFFFLSLFFIFWGYFGFWGWGWGLGGGKSEEGGGCVEGDLPQPIWSSSTTLLPTVTEARGDGGPTVEAGEIAPSWC